jgi:hypothetical protein
VKKAFVILLIVAVVATSTLGQESGNRNYNPNSGQRASPNTGLIGNGGDQSIEAYLVRSRSSRWSSALCI